MRPVHVSAGQGFADLAPYGGGGAALGAAGVPVAIEALGARRRAPAARSLSRSMGPTVGGAAAYCQGPAGHGNASPSLGPPAPVRPSRSLTGRSGACPTTAPSRFTSSSAARGPFPRQSPGPLDVAYPEASPPHTASRGASSPMPGPPQHLDFAGPCAVSPHTGPGNALSMPPEGPRLQHSPLDTAATGALPLPSRRLSRACASFTDGGAGAVRRAERVELDPQQSFPLVTRPLLSVSASRRASDDTNAGSIGNIKGGLGHPKECLRPGRISMARDRGRAWQHTTPAEGMASQTCPSSIQMAAGAPEGAPPVSVIQLRQGRTQDSSHARLSPRPLAQFAAQPQQLDLPRPAAAGGSPAETHMSLPAGSPPEAGADRGPPAPLPITGNRAKLLQRMDEVVAEAAAQSLSQISTSAATPIAASSPKFNDGDDGRDRIGFPAPSMHVWPQVCKQHVDPPTVSSSIDSVFGLEELEPIQLPSSQAAARSASPRTNAQTVAKLLSIAEGLQTQLDEVSSSVQAERQERRQLHAAVASLEQRVHGGRAQEPAGLLGGSGPALNPGESALGEDLCNELSALQEQAARIEMQCDVSVASMTETSAEVHDETHTEGGSIRTVDTTDTAAEPPAAASAVTVPGAKQMHGGDRADGTLRDGLQRLQDQLNLLQAQQGALRAECKDQQLQAIAAAEEASSQNRELVASLATVVKSTEARPQKEESLLNSIQDLQQQFVSIASEADFKTRVSDAFQNFAEQQQRLEAEQAQQRQEVQALVAAVQEGAFGGAGGSAGSADGRTAARMAAPARATSREAAARGPLAQDELLQEVRELRGEVAKIAGTVDVLLRRVDGLAQARGAEASLQTEVAAVASVVSKLSAKMDMLAPDAGTVGCRGASAACDPMDKAAAAAQAHELRPRLAAFVGDVRRATDEGWEAQQAEQQQLPSTLGSGRAPDRPPSPRRWLTEPLSVSVARLMTR